MENGKLFCTACDEIKAAERPEVTSHLGVSIHPGKPATTFTRAVVDPASADRDGGSQGPICWVHFSSSTSAIADQIAQQEFRGEGSDHLWECDTEGELALKDVLQRADMADHREQAS